MQQKETQKKSHQPFYACVKQIEAKQFPRAKARHPVYLTTGGSLRNPHSTYGTPRIYTDTLHIPPLIFSQPSTRTTQYKTK